MEGSEIPKGELPNQVPSLENKELEQKASELAKTTRERGMGILMGKFPPRLSPPGQVGGYTFIGEFIQGVGEEEVSLDITALINRRFPTDANDIIGDKTIHAQWWVKNQYVPKMAVRQEKQIKETPREVKRLFGLVTTTHIDRKPVTVKIPTNTPLSCNGKKGEKDWIQYDYAMALDYSYDPRRTILVMSIAVPPDIAIQIDKQVENNVYFPDTYFKALYPGYTGPDLRKDIKRKEATKLQVMDMTQKPPKGEVKEYPQPIPY